MESPRVCRRRKLCRLVAVVAAVAALPILLWTAVLLIAPTGWARGRVERELEEATGRKVAIEAIRLGPLGNLRVRGLAIAEKTTPDDPWLKVAEARLDVHLLRLLTGRCKPSDIDVDGLDLRVHRRADGTLEFGDLLASDPKAQASGRSRSSDEPCPGATLRLGGARVTVIDEPSGSRVDLSGINGTATWDGRVADVPILKGGLNGGTFAFALHYERSDREPSFRAEFRARGVALGGGDGAIRALGLFAPVVAADVAGDIDGRCDFVLALRGQGSTAEAIKRSLAGHGSIKLDPIDLTGSKIYAAFKAARQIRRASRVGSVESHFAVGNGRVVTDDLTVTIARLPTVLAGWTDFDGRIDYTVKSDALDSRLPPEARGFLGELRRDLGELSHLRITGTIDAPQVFAGTVGMNGRGLKDEDKARLEEAARVLREKYLR
jgi:AsmA protein